MYFLVLLLVLPLLVGDYYLYLVSECAIISLVAMSNNLELGFGGMLQLHQCVYFGTGAYAYALLVMKAGISPLPSIVLAVIISALVGLLIGWFCVRLHGIYFGMLTLALGQLVWAIVFKWYSLTGGDNGIQDIPVPSFLQSMTASYFFSITIVAVFTLILYFIVRSPFGKVLQGIRDNEERCEAIGINTKGHKLIAYVMGSALAGIAGAVFCIHARSLSPDLLYWEKSAEVLVMCLLGGMFTFSGPIFGAFAITLFQSLSSAYTEYQTMILGIILVVVVILLPEGVMGYLEGRVWKRSLS